ncbi:MAG TPA: efflux RND transporter permease subunit, partial [Myxococcota bacterium]|nr:efflux RND transporter permease subunit [Myxococcota bacterium]
TISVNASLPGASPETMASSVATPLERRFGRIAGVTEITSSNALGSTSITLQFDLNRDVDSAARDVQAAIAAARADLPPDLPSNPTYRKVNPADAPILILALTSKTLPVGEIYDAAASVLQQRLSEISGVGQVYIGGSSLPAVRVELNPQQLGKYGIQLEEVRAAISATNANRPKGELTDAVHRWTIAANDQLERAEQYRPIVVTYRDGAPVRLGDLASIEDSVEDVRTIGLSGEKTAVLVILFRQPGANILETVGRVRAALPQLEAALPAAIDVSIPLDRTPPIRASLRDVELTLVLAVVLVILVIFATLRSARASLIPSVAVPVSLIGTFGGMYLAGYTLDTLSLMALTVATGFVVDDAIVVLENIARHIEAGMPPRQAAVVGSRETAFTVISMSLSLVAVFIPILLMGGVVGRLFREFAVTLALAVAISLVLSLTTTPVMCAALLRPHTGKPPGRLSRASERVFDALHGLYARTLSVALRRRRITFAIAIAMVGLNVWMFTVVPKGFFPSQDTGRLAGAIQADESISFQAMREKLAQALAIVVRDRAVDSVIGFTGGSGGGGSTRNSARMFIALKPLEQRRESADSVIARLRGPLSHIPGAPAFLQPVQDIRVGGRISNALYQYTLTDGDLAELDAWSPRVERALRKLPELVDFSSDQQNKGLESQLVVDRATASRLGLTAQQIDAALYDAFGQRQVSVIYRLLNQYHVVMEVAPHFWQSPETLRQLTLATPDGEQVPLLSFSHYAPGVAPLAVSHQGQFPAV